MSAAPRPDRRGPVPSRPPLTAAVVLAVAAGGMVGTLVRWLLVEVAPAPASSPVAGWLALTGVNLLGSYLLGVLHGVASRRPRPRWLTAGLGVGVLGSFTSLSSVVLAAAVATGAGPQSGPDGLGVTVLTGLAAVAVLGLGAALGTVAALAGARLGRRAP